MAHDILNVSLPPRTGAARPRYLEIFSLVFFVLAAALYATSISGDVLPRDYMRFVVGRDFLNLWMYGRAAFEADPSRFYDVELYNAALRAIIGGEYFGQTWSYPPSVMLIA